MLLPAFLQKDEPKDQNAKMIKILSGEMAIELHLQFLIRNNNTDLMILKNTKVILARHPYNLQDLENKKLY